MSSKKRYIPYNNLDRAFRLCRAGIEKAIKRVLDSSQYVLGKEVSLFEKEQSEYYQLKYAIGVGSGTDALRLSLLANDVGPNSFVLTVANSAPATVAAIRSTGARLLFTEVDEDGLMDSDLILDQDLQKAKAIVPVHLYGRVMNLERIQKRAPLIPIIEDACQAHGSSHPSYSFGNSSVTTCFSYYPTKNLGAIGDGGLVLTNQKSLADRIRRLRNYGLEKEEMKEFGTNSRLDEIQAAILRARSSTLVAINDYKKLLANQYYNNLLDVKYVRARIPSVTENCHIYPIFVEDRDRLREFLAKNGIQTKIHYPIPAHKQPCELFVHPPMPMTEELCRTELSVPNWYGMNFDDVDYVCKLIRRFYGQG